MIQPNEVQQKAKNLYGEFVRWWLTQEGAFFPRQIRAQRDPDPESPSAIDAVRKLREESKEVLGYGYSVEWREVNSRRFGRNSFPDRINIETQDDFLRLIGKQKEFSQFKTAVESIRSKHHELERWIRSNIAFLTEIAPEVDGLLEVVELFRRTSRPNRFARELPLSVDTKFIERNQRVLRQWLDLILPPHVIRADEEHFERRYGLRYAEPHLLIRFLNKAFQERLGFPCEVLSLPLHDLAKWDPGAASVFIVENKVNLLTLPLGCGDIALGGLGNGAALLRYLSWLSHMSILYWGDLDGEGLLILSNLRSYFPATKSFLMDEAALKRWKQISVEGSGRLLPTPAHLTQAELMAFRECMENNIRIEQERIPQNAVLLELGTARGG